MDAITPEVDGKRIGKHLVARVRVKLPLVLQRASPPVAGVAEAASVAGQPNAADLEEA